MASIAADAELFLDEHRPHKALAAYQQAFAILEAALGPDHPDVARVLVGIGRARLDLGERARAAAALRRAIEIYEASDAGAEVIANARRALARAQGSQ